MCQFSGHVKKIISEQDYIRGRRDTLSFFQEERKTGCSSRTRFCDQMLCYVPLKDKHGSRVEIWEREQKYLREKYLVVYIQDRKLRGGEEGARQGRRNMWKIFVPISKEKYSR